MPIAGELVIDSPGSEPVRIRLEHESYTLGRSPANELSFPADHGLSREHLVFQNSSEGWLLRDAGSSNGTRLNGGRLIQPVKLSNGDVITAGHLSIRFTAPGEETDPRSEHVTFVDQTAGLALPPLAVDLPSALRRSNDLDGGSPHGKFHWGALVRASRELAGQASLEGLFHLILDLSLDAVEASRGVVMTRNGDGCLETRAIRGEGFQISTKVRDRVLDERMSLLVRDVNLDWDFARQQSLIEQQIRSFLAVPLQTGDKVIGLIYLDAPKLVRDFVEEDLSLLTVMANIAAIRIEQSRLTEAEQEKKLLVQDLERAAEIQRRLLPGAAPRLAGFDIAGYNAPCRTVGGDYFDFLHYPDGYVGVFIGDVSGKGMSAALLMSSLQARVQVLFEARGGLAEQVVRLNRITAGNCLNECFVTLFAAILDPTTGRIVYCNAGHNPPLIVHKNDAVERLPATGLILGVKPDAEYEEGSCVLNQEDLLVLFSDGLTEACSVEADEEFGEERLVELLKRERHKPAAEIIECIKQVLMSFTGSAPPADDITVVLARRL